MVTTDPTGTPIGPVRHYDPYGQPDNTLPDNSTGNADYGWLGQHQRLTEHQPGHEPLIEMGARPYSPALGRFLEVDPIEGGSANQYEYAEGDPIGGRDLDGQAVWVGDNQFGCGFDFPDGDLPYLRGGTSFTRLGFKPRLRCPSNPGTMRITITIYVRISWFAKLNVGSRTYTLTGSNNVLRPLDFEASCIPGKHKYWAVVLFETSAPDGRSSKYRYKSRSNRVRC